MNAIVLPEPVGDKRITSLELVDSAIFFCMGFSDSMSNFCRIALRMSDSFILILFFAKIVKGERRIK